jgi:hypothetical protein
MMAIELLPFGSAWLRLNAFHIIAEGEGCPVKVRDGYPRQLRYTYGPVPSNR